MSPIDRVADWFWITFPALAGRRSRALGSVLGDGSYLLAWPTLAALAPIVAIGVGFAVGAFRPSSEAIFSFSIAWPMLLVAPAAFGAGLGTWAWLGFVVGDFVFFPHLFWKTTAIEHVITERLPLVVTYEVLLGLMVLLPLAARVMPTTVLRPIQARLPAAVAAVVGLILAAAVAGMTAASWSSAAQVLLRTPTALGAEGAQSPVGVQSLRLGGVALIALASALTAVRFVIEGLASRRGASNKPGERSRPIAVPASEAPGVADEIVGVLLSSVVLTFGLVGLLDEPWEAGILFGAVFASGVARSILLPRLRGYSTAVNRIPLLARILALGGIGYLVGEVILTVLNDNPPYVGLSSRPLVIAAAISILVAGLLLPAAPTAPRTSEAMT